MINLLKNKKHTYGIILFMFMVICTYGIILGTIKTYAYEPMANEKRISDKANLFSEKEETILLDKLIKLQEKTKMGFAIVTIDYNNKTAMEYADDYFDYNNVALDEKYDGALLLVDMYNGDLWISTSGDMIIYLTDHRIDNILDRIIGYAYTEEFFKCADIFIDCVDIYYDEGIPTNQYTYNEETGTIIKHKSITGLELAISLIAPLFASAIAIANVKCEYSMEDRNKEVSNSFNIGYRRNTIFKPKQTPEDTCTGTRISKTIISSSSGGSGSRSGGGSRSSGRSSTHRSSSGRSHGGGGRNFR